MSRWRDNVFFGALTLLWSVVVVVVVVLGILLAAPFLGPRQAFFRVGPWCYRGIFWFCGISCSFEGWEELPEAIRTGQQPAIFMANHESQLDPPFLVGALPAHPVFIAKKEVKLIPFVGWAAMCAGTIFIDRGHRERAIGSLSFAAQAIRGGKSVVVFPEGTRTRTGELLTLKKGTFNLALEAGVPIVPLGIHGAFHILPPGAKRIRPGHYRLRVGQPVDPAQAPSREALMEAVRGSILRLSRG